MSTDILSLKEVVGGYGEVQIIHGVSLNVREGSVTALLGANGAGKTTIMLMLAGVLPVTQGEVLFDGKSMGAQRGHQRVNAGMVLVPEGRRVFPNLSVEENLRLGGIVPAARPTWKQRIEEMYELFPRLRERRSQAAGTLSGGEQQMLAIARGLMARPKLLLLDEPTLGLAPIMAQLVFDTIRSLNKDGLSILIAEQDTRNTLNLADEAYVVENGRITLHGSSDNLKNDPRVKEAYLGL
ncbi:ABC transporter ATP-binding protein [Neopusillimonas maritima]|jgi:branched-chain amino acid transport system ATP-binding protein|uniref:ABC transporter ATP-binding protein n=1 Tax=Neopusillimonas maritima TaxID=2026239 RepID=UPI001C5667D1|nr:ABC transporter ATP-binding protein [Neopusillimonas maritima]|tara:strand:- start:212250 stop:212966 length:717 start_codon:yes stop_codon:yes gene_type:complete